MYRYVLRVTEYILGRHGVILNICHVVVSIEYTEQHTMLTTILNNVLYINYIAIVFGQVLHGR